MGERILITGSSGLIGRAVGAGLRADGVEVVGLDLRAEDDAARGDFRDEGRLAAAMHGVDGILHLGGVSRVIDGERAPDHCRSVNVEATRRLLDLAGRAPQRPWVIYASSREVYGQQDKLPVPETAPLRPKNVYARSKAAAEQAVAAARAAGMANVVLRFSNVYGDVRDHADRVVPAFARVAASGPREAGTVRVDGSNCSFDFTYVADVADGIRRVVQLMQDGERALPPIHFTTGRETTLGRLADLALEHGGPDVSKREAPARGFDVQTFAGDPAAAHRLLGWRARTSIEAGFAQLVADYRAADAAAIPHGGLPGALAGAKRAGGAVRGLGRG